MKNLEEVYTYHTDIINEVQFLKREIEFLIRILRNCYSTSINNEKIKLLDGYWKGFEHNVTILNELQEKIANDERNIALLYKHGVIDSNNTSFIEDNFLKVFNEVNKNVKVLKDSFYEYMHGCNACSLKSA